MRAWKAWAGAAVLPASIAIWLIVASSVWCSTSQVCVKGDLWILQWWFELPFWRTNWYVTLLVVISGVAASGVVATLLAGIWISIKPNKRQPDIYGSTRFASRRQMQDNGIRSKGRLF